MIAPLVIGATLGLASSVHCIGMCGPLVAGGCQRNGAVDRRAALGYALGRVLGYATVGGIAASLGRPFVGSGVARVAQIAAALGVALVLATTAIRWLRRPRKDPPLVRLRTPTLRSALLDALPRRGLGLGLATSVFPCGALASGVLAAAASGSWPAGALLMAAFALASLPALAISVVFGDRALRVLRGASSRHVRAAAGIALLGVAAFIAIGPWMHRGDSKAEGHTCCHPK